MSALGVIAGAYAGAARNHMTLKLVFKVRQLEKHMFNYYNDILIELSKNPTNAFSMQHEKIIQDRQFVSSSQDAAL